VTTRARLVVVAGLLTAGAVVAAGCSSSTGPPTVVAVDTLGTSPATTGVLLHYVSTDGPQWAWLDSIQPRVGDNDAAIDGSAFRGLLTFALPAAPSGASVGSAILHTAECSVVGSPFAKLGAIIADHLLPTATPDSATFDTTAIASDIATIATDTTSLAIVTDVTASVASDYAAARPATMLRFRFSLRDSNEDAISDNVTFCPSTLVVSFARR